MTYYREATVHTQELLDLLVKCENKIQTVRLWLSRTWIYSCRRVFCYCARCLVAISAGFCKATADDASAFCTRSASRSG